MMITVVISIIYTKQMRSSRFNLSPQHEWASYSDLRYSISMIEKINTIITAAKITLEAIVLLLMQ